MNKINMLFKKLKENEQITIEELHNTTTLGLRIKHY